MERQEYRRHYSNNRAASQFKPGCFVPTKMWTRKDKDKDKDVASSGREGTLTSRGRRLGASSAAGPLEKGEARNWGRPRTKTS